jgi:hypothetical protein
MYTVSDVVEIGAAQDIVLGAKNILDPEDSSLVGPFAADDHDE